jgi:hypothetical protein
VDGETLRSIGRSYNVIAQTIQRLGGSHMPRCFVMQPFDGANDTERLEKLFDTKMAAASIKATKARKAAIA